MQCFATRDETNDVESGCVVGPTVRARNDLRGDLSGLMQAESGSREFGGHGASTVDRKEAEITARIARRCIGRFTANEFAPVGIVGRVCARVRENAFRTFARRQNDVPRAHLLGCVVLGAVLVEVLLDIGVCHDRRLNLRAKLVLEFACKLRIDRVANGWVAVETARVRFGGEQFAVHPRFEKRAPLFGRCEPSTEVLILQVDSACKITERERRVTHARND
jgi:hypothetical protein